MQLNPFRSWSARFIRQHVPHMRFGSILTYRSSTLRRASVGPSYRSLLQLSLRSNYGGALWLRSGTSDDDTLYEVFVRRIYKSVVERAAGAEYVMDLGANTGLATRYFLGHFADAKVFAVEPDPENFDLLSRNLATPIESGRCSVLRAAVWSREATLDLTHAPQSTGFNAIRTLESPNPERGTAGMPMAKLIKRSGFPRLDVLKVDIEGAEVELFRHDSSWLHNVRTLAIEFHGDSRARSGFDCAMHDFGFTIDDSDAHTVVATRA
jgi:FkbM family methyltransferase